VRGMLVGHVARVEVVVGEVEEKSSRGRVAETGGGGRVAVRVGEQSSEVRSCLVVVVDGVSSARVVTAEWRSPMLVVLSCCWPWWNGGCDVDARSTLLAGPGRAGPRETSGDGE
jgi:hypothetical protein